MVGQLPPAIASPTGAEQLVVYADGIPGTVTTEQIAEIGGGGGGGSLTVSDGTTTATDVTDLMFTGATVTNPSGGVALVTVTGGGGGSGPWELAFFPQQNNPPASEPALITNNNGHALLSFNSATALTAIFSEILPVAYAGGGLIVTLWWACPSDTAGNVGWTVAIEREEVGVFNLGTDSFATAQTVTAVAVPTTDLIVASSSVTITSGAEMDGLLAGELFRLAVALDTTNTTITAGHTIYLVAASVVEA